MPVHGKLFRNGRSQAVRLPAEFRFEGDRVRVTRHGRGVLLEPVVDDVGRWFATLDRIGGELLVVAGGESPGHRDDDERR